MSTLNPLNDISRTYLETIAKMNKREEETEVKRWEGELNLQMKTQASLNNEAVYGKTPAQVEADRRKKDNLAGAPLTVTNADKKANTKAYQNYKAGVKGYKAADHMGEGHSMNIQGKKNCGCGQDPCVTYGKQDKKSMKEEKKAKKDYDGDGKIESGKDEYFGSKDKAIKKAMGKKSPEAIEASRRKKDNLAGAPMKEAIGEGDPQDDAIKQYVKFSSKKRPRPVKKVKESFSDWRNDLREIVSAHPMTDVETEKEVTEKKGIKNKVIINPKMSEAVAEIGGQVISETEVDLQEKQKDTPDQVKAVIAYDKARKGTRDATYDSMHGKKKQAKKERDYAKWQRDKGAEDAQKSGHRWKHAKGSTREKEGKKSETHAYIKDSFAVEGYGKKKKKHDCASKVKHEEFGIGNCIKGMHTIDENNMVTHYDVEFKKYIVENCPVEELEILVSEMHTHTAMKEGVVSKEVKALSKAGKTLKGKDVAKADKIDMPTSKGYKFGVKEAKDWIQGAVKRPGAFTRKAKAAGQSVQQFAKTVDDNPSKYSTRTKKQANLAQTFASMKKEDVEEQIFNYIVESTWYEFIDEGYQRNPEKGEAEAIKKKREQKGGYDAKRAARMNDPKTGINSDAFKEFMRSRGM